MKFTEWLAQVHPLIREADLYIQIYYYTYFRDTVPMEGD
jgi:hypothetical protein